MIAEPSELASQGTQVTTLLVVVGSLQSSDPYPLILVHNLHPKWQKPSIPVVFPLIPYHNPSLYVTPHPVVVQKRPWACLCRLEIIRAPSSSYSLCPFVVP